MNRTGFESTARASGGRLEATVAAPEEDQWFPFVDVHVLDLSDSQDVVPGVVDFTDQADAAYRDFESAGMHLVRSTTLLDSWDGFERALIEERR